MSQLNSGASYSRGMATAFPQGITDVSHLDDVGRILATLPMATLIVDATATIRRTSARAEALGLVRREAIAVEEIRALVSESARTGEVRERELHVRRPPLGRGMLDLRVAVTPLSGGHYAVLVADQGEDRRVDAVRRDFVANVSHELKTPVGAMSLLAEAVLSASDDPEAVQRFAERMLTESARLSSLINDIIELSRVQGDDALARAEAFDIDGAIGQAVDELRTVINGKEIELVVTGSPGAEVMGDRRQVVAALRNLIANAVHYSPDHTRVAVTAQVQGEQDEIVQIDVKDQGIGIPSQDLDRIFERFYRSDPARSRGTGGTGLGLAIAKHVCENHGGDISVWSEVGIGSTFTIRLPLASRTRPEDDQQSSVELD
jgi:two-component system sensor histidine kinase SenX3